MMYIILTIAVIIFILMLWINLRKDGNSGNKTRKKLPRQPWPEPPPPPPQRRMAEPPSMQPSYMSGKLRLVKTKNGSVVPAYYSRGKYYAHGSNKYNNGSDVTNFVLYYMLWSSWMDSHTGDWNDVLNDSWTEHSVTDDSGMGGSSYESESSHGGSDYGSSGGEYDSGSSGGGGCSSCD